MDTAKYRSCCTDAGLIWKNGYCTNDSQATCASLGEVEGGERNFDVYLKCVKDAGGSTSKANGKYYRFSGCKN